MVETFIDENGKLNYEKVYRRGNPIGNASIDQEATFSRAFRDIRNRDFPYYNFGLQLNIPIPNRSARAGYKTAQLQNERAVLQHKELEQNILVSIDGLIRDAEYRFEQISVTRQARISSNLAYQNQTKRYNEGAINNYQLLQAQRDLTNRRYSEINAKVQYLIAIARLAEAEGDSLKKNNIAIDYDSE